MKYRIDNDIPIPTLPQAECLKLAQEFYKAGGIGKSTAAKKAIKKLGSWREDEQVAIDYIRQRLK